MSMMKDEDIKRQEEEQKKTKPTFSWTCSVCGKTDVNYRRNGAGFCDTHWEVS